MNITNEISADYRFMAMNLIQLFMVTLAFIMSRPEYKRNKKGEYLYLLCGLGIIIVFSGFNTLVMTFRSRETMDLPSVDLLNSFLEAVGLLLIAYFFLLAASPNPPSILRLGRIMMFSIIGITAFFMLLQLVGLIQDPEGWAIAGRPTFRMILLIVIFFGFIQMTQAPHKLFAAIFGFLSLALSHIFHLFYYNDVQSATFIQSLYPYPYVFNPIGYFLIVVAVDRKIAEDQTRISEQLKTRSQELEQVTANLTKLNRLSTNLLRTTDLRGIIRMILDALSIDLGYKNSALFILDKDAKSLRGFKISGLTGVPVSFPHIQLDRKSFAVDSFLQAKPSFFGEGKMQPNAEFIRDYDFSTNIVTIPLLTKKEQLCYELQPCTLKSCPVKGWDLNICWMMTDERCPCYNANEANKILRCFGCSSFNAVGMIVIDNRIAKTRLDEKNVAFLETFANQAGLALQSGFLVEDLSKESTLRTETLRNLPVGVIVLNTDGNISEFNDAICQIMEIEPYSAVRGHFTEYKIIDDSKSLNEEIQSILESLSSGMHREITTHILTVKGKTKILNVQLRPILKNLALNGLIIMVEDITSMKELERQLIRSEALASMGQLAMGIAHEINNPIAGVSGILQVLGKRFPDDSSERKAINQAHNDLKRASNIIKDLLNFAKPSPPARRLMDLNKLVEDAMAFLPYQPGGDKAIVSKDIDDALPLASFDPDQIQQVLTNLILNALYAVSEKQTGNQKIDFSTWFDKNWLYFQIEDNGIGISPENLEKIFEPFFTTKKTGKGTGLGLSLCDRIISDHGGILTVRSEVGKGTAFLIKLPRKSV